MQMLFQSILLLSIFPLWESTSNSTIYIRSSQVLYYLQSPDMSERHFVYSFNNLIDLRLDTFEDRTKSLIFGASDPATVIIYRSLSSQPEFIDLSSGGAKLFSFTTFNGTLFVITGKDDPSQFTVSIMDLVTGINSTHDFTFNLYYVYSGFPLYYNPETSKLSMEVEDHQQGKYMIYFDPLSTTSQPQPFNLITGAYRIWKEQVCPGVIFTFEKGILMAIQNDVVYTILSIPCDMNALLTIDWSQSIIWTVDSCSESRRIRQWDFTGAVLSQSSLLWESNQDIYGYQVVFDIKRPASCPWIPKGGGGGSPSPQGPPPPADFLINDGLSVVIGLGTFNFICIVIIIILTVTLTSRKSLRDGYTEVQSGSTSGMSLNFRLHEALTASGGKIEVEEIQTKELIGHGSFANVYRGIYHETEVAIKVVKVSSMQEMEKSLLEEASLMVKLRHPHIVLFMGACIKHPDLFIVTEYMANGSVRELLDKKDEVKLEMEHIRKMSLDACKGMAFLHSKKIIHRDLKSHNLLVDRMWNVKVADFGLSRAMGEGEGTMTACGTPSWAAPEVIRRDHYSYKADVYSFAICFWEMNTRNRPYSDLKPYQVVLSVAKGLRPDIDPSIPSDFQNIMRVCWSEFPEDRPDFPQLKEIFEEVVCPVPRTPYPSYSKPITAGPLPEDSKISLPDLANNKKYYSSANEMVTRNRIYKE